MKHFLFILSLLFITSIPAFAQDDEEADVDDKIQDKMSEYIQRRLDLTRDETSKFAPVFIRYFREWRQVLRENRQDRLERQKKIIDLRLKFRPEFRTILGEKRGNQVFVQHDRFIKELIEIRRQQLRNNPGNRPLRRNATNFIIK